MITRDPPPPNPRPPRLPRQWWASAGLATLAASFVLLAVLVWTGAPNLIALNVLLLSWGVIATPINGLGLNTVRRATLYQVLAGFVLVILGMWLGAGDADKPVIFSFGLLIYPGAALVLNPVVVRVVETIRARR